ncbi:interferon-induced very large GTPase 1-like isoform X2 [Apostichopus japonicus]|uniref:interferon-induced very large GTPase 1-like isoform X2 n=1 Tax=Stichopus japonicus TaxID=307972 RepID=UPI003AB7D6B7
MEPHHKKALNRTLILFKDSLEPNMIIPFLIKDGIMSFHDRDEIKSETIRQERVLNFIANLQRKGGRAYECFMRALQEVEEYDTLAATLKRNEERENRKWKEQNYTERRSKSNEPDIQHTYWTNSRSVYQKLLKTSEAPLHQASTSRSVYQKLLKTSEAPLHQASTEQEDAATERRRKSNEGALPDVEPIYETNLRSLYQHVSQTSAAPLHPASTEQEDAASGGDFSGIREKEEDLKTFMTDSGLVDYYPCKLTLTYVKEVRTLDVMENNPALLFITKLTSFDCRVVWRENIGLQHGSFRDFLFALFHCSDPHLRQHIMEKLSACQLAVTVLLPSLNVLGKPVLLLWALRRIVKMWKEKEGSFAIERNMISTPIFTAAFIRVGDIPISKSLVLNDLLGRVQGYESYRYFLSHEDEKEDIFFASGSVEAQWYLPIHGRKEDILNEPTLLLNLRGDSRESISETKVLCKVANAVFLFVDNAEVKRYAKDIDVIRNMFPKVVIIYLNSQSTQTQKQKTTYLSSVRSKKQFRLRGSDDNCIEFDTENDRSADLSKEICHKVLEACSCTDSADYKRIDTWHKLCGGDIEIDEDTDCYKEARKLFREVFPDPSFSANVKKIKESLTLHKDWLEWVKIDQEPLSTTDERIENQLEQKRQKKSQIRDRQSAQGLSGTMQRLQNNLQQISNRESDNTIHYFMTLFQSYIEELNSSTLPPLMAKIDECNAFLKHSKRTITAVEKVSNAAEKGAEKEDRIKQILKETSEQFSQIHLTCEHFIREFGQLFEANVASKANHEDPVNKRLTDMAATLLMNGYPLEILDGECAYVPINWICGVLNSVSKTLNNPNIFVLSIIGVQSSGKSTLFNSMFGVRFPVRAGRCTRGLFLQLLKVSSECQENFKFEYLVVIDTEGLQSPDRTVNNDRKFDNTIATLAMCVGDLTLLNIGQETIGKDMIDILQIVVHALIRMKQVKLVSHCRIIQQRVGDIGAAGSNQSNMAIIKEALNKATLAAAREEQVENVKEFSDLFPLIEEHDLQFFPCLWMGPMSPPNSAYSEKVQSLKTNMFSSKDNHCKLNPKFTFEKFISLLSDVWVAVSEEDFVFHFQNTFDILSHQSFRFEQNKLIGTMRTNMVEWELKNELHDFSQSNRHNFLLSLEKTVRKEWERVTDAIDAYVKEHADEEEVKRRETSIKKDAEDVARDIERAIKQNLEYQFKTQNELDSLPQFFKNAKLELRKAAREKALEVRSENPRKDWKKVDEFLSNTFDDLWRLKCSDIESKYSQHTISSDAIDLACENSVTKLLTNSPFSKTLNMVVERKAKEETGILKRYGKRVLDGIFGSKDNSPSYGNEFVILLTTQLKLLRREYRLKPFNRIKVDGILSLLFDELKKQNLNDTVIVNALLASKEEIAKVCKYNQNQLSKKYSPTLLFQAEERQLRQDFYSYFVATVKKRSAPSRAYSDLLSVCLDLVIDELNVKLLRKLRNISYLNDKKIMIGTVLQELCRREDPEEYYQFIQYNDQFIEKWLQSKIIETLVSQTVWLREICQEIIGPFLESMELVLVTVGEKLQQQRSQGRKPTLAQWVEIMLKQPYVADNVKFQQAFVISDDTTVYSSSFTEILHTLIDKNLQKDVLQELQLNAAMNKDSAMVLLSKMKIDIQFNILDHLQGCEQVCPFCKANCFLQGQNHLHQAITHYPQGLAGFRNVETKLLSREPCTMLVARKSYWTYRMKTETKYKPYKKYANEFPDWDIAAMKYGEPADYWKWVMVKCNKYFSQKFDSKPASMPASWKTLTKDHALRSLKELYKV